MVRLLIVLVLASSCSKAHIAGLPAGVTLPAGAKVVSTQTDAAGTCITFDATGDWNTVKSHFDQQLAGLGYDTNPGKKQVIAHIRAKHPDWDDAKVKAKYQWVQSTANKVTGASQSSIAEYEKPGSPMIIVIDLHFGKNMESALGKNSFKTGDYSITVANASSAADLSQSK